MLRFASIFLVATLWGQCLAGSLAPLEPAPNDKFTQGGSLSIAWTPDTTGAWKNTNIELMTGDNFNMIHLTTLASIDGTDATKTTLTVPCPSFSAPGLVAWTGRFIIVGSDGTTVPPPNSTQPDGSNIPWGVGMLVPPSFPGTPPPSTAPPGQVDASGSNGSTGPEISSSGSSSGTSSSSSSSSSSSVTEGLGASVPSSSNSSPVVTPTVVGPLPGETTPPAGGISPTTQPTSGSDTDSNPNSNPNSNSNSSPSSNSTTPTNTPKSNALSLTHAFSSLTSMSIFITILALGTALSVI